MQKFLFGNLMLYWIRVLSPTTHNGKDKRIEIGLFVFFIFLEKNWPTVSSLDVIYSAKLMHTILIWIPFSGKMNLTLFCFIMHSKLIAVLRWYSIEIQKIVHF